MTTIRTNFWAKPIPLRQFDWEAWYEGGSETAIGHGRTKEDAVADLLESYPPPCVDCRGKGGILPGIECATCEGTGDRMRDDPLDPLLIVSSAS